MTSSSSPPPDSSTPASMAASLSFNHPPHSAIHFCNIKTLVPIVLDYTNYTLWRGLFLPVFKSYNVYGFIDGSYPCPESTILSDSGTPIPNPAFQQWIQLDSAVLSWIQSSLSQEILQAIINPDHSLTSRDAWLQIERLFSGVQSVQKQYKPINQLDAKKMLLRRRICKHSEKRPFIRFGPLYGPGEDEIEEKKIQAAKEEVWHNILRSSPRNDEETKASYISEIRSIENEARDTYKANDRSFLEMTGTQFRLMMLKDGCFFLQMSLFILQEGSNHVPHDHKLVGELLQNQKQQCIASMFHVGNQIPLVVLKSLIKQSYFKKVIASGNWKRPSSDLANMVLYDFLILPALIYMETERRSNQLLFPRTKLKAKRQLQQHQPCDVLHGLHLLLVGPENNNSIIKDKRQVADTDDIDDAQIIDLEAGHHGANSSTTMLRKSGTNSTTSDQKKEFRSASELKQAGIKFKVFDGIGIRGIRFKKRYYPLIPFLAMPSFLVNVHSQLLFQSLKDYETAQKFDENQREVTSYLKFMHELIQTSEDARVLHSDKIIQGSWRHTEKVPRFLKEIAGEEEITSPKLRLAKFQVNYFDRPPWVNLMSQYFSLIFALTVIQTFYAVFAYHKPNSA